MLATFGIRLSPDRDRGLASNLTGSKRSGKRGADTTSVDCGLTKDCFMSSRLRLLAVSCVGYALLAFSQWARADILMPAATTTGTLVFTPGAHAAHYYVQSEVGGGHNHGPP